MKQQIVSLILAMLIPTGVLAQVTPQGGDIHSRDRGKEGAEGFVGWVESYTHLFWDKFSVPGLPDAEAKLLSMDRTTGARSQITRLPAGWSHPRGYHNTNEEIFVLDGDLTIGGKLMTKYSFAYFPAGYAHGDAYSKYGATLLHFWDAEPDFVQAGKSLANVRLDEVVEDWNFYDRPWTKNENFVKWADFPPPADTRIKLLRQDKKTGQMTWINWFKPSYTDFAGQNAWEVHPSWEEFLLLEGDLTFSECMPGTGPMKTTYQEGGYFWRPKNIRHVGPGIFATGHVMFLHRSGAPLWADYYPDCNEGP